MTMWVAELWSHPVKSLVGTSVDTAVFDTFGMVGDRVIAFRDLRRGRLAGSRQYPALAQWRAVGSGDHLAIALPDGSTVTLSDDLAPQALGEALGTDIAIEHLAPADQLDSYRRRPDPDAAADPEGYLRDVLGREADEPLPDFAKFGPSILEFETPPGTFVDCFPVLILTTSALRSMAAALPDSVIDVRRFRPNLVIDTGDTPGHPEFEWAGRDLVVGDVVLEVVNDCPRCVAITRGLDSTVPDDRGILRHVVRELGQAVGMYCNVRTGGTVTVGASVTLAS